MSETETAAATIETQAAPEAQPVTEAAPVVAQPEAEGAQEVAQASPFGEVLAEVAAETGPLPQAEVAAALADLDAAEPVISFGVHGDRLHFVGAGIAAGLPIADSIENARLWVDWIIAGATDEHRHVRGSLASAEAARYETLRFDTGRAAELESIVAWVVTAI